MALHPATVLRDAGTTVTCAAGQNGARRRWSYNSKPRPVILTASAVTYMSSLTFASIRNVPVPSGAPGSSTPGRGAPGWPEITVSHATAQLPAQVDHVGCRAKTAPGRVYDRLVPGAAAD